MLTMAEQRELENLRAQDQRESKALAVHGEGPGALSNASDSDWLAPKPAAKP
jgi:hypothetical protein